MSENNGALWLITTDEFGDYLEIPMSGGVTIAWVEGDGTNDQKRQVDNEEWHSVIHVSKFHAPNAVAIECADGRVFLATSQPVEVE